MACQFDFMETIVLNDGNTLPLLGFGTYKCREDEGVRAITQALQHGYRLIDTAAIYMNEEVVARGIAESDVDREDVYITSKVWRENLGYLATKKACVESLQRLNTKYIDLYLIHWPANARNFDDWENVNAETWRALEELREEGLVKSIGVSNFWEEHLNTLLQAAHVMPAVNQIEFHPGYWQKEVVEFCEKNKIIVEAWSPLARGSVFSDPTLQRVASQHSKSVAQVCLRWILQHGAIGIPKTVSEKRMIENIQIFDFTLTKQDMKEIDNLPEMGFSGELPNLWPERI